MAENAHTTPTPSASATRDDFDHALVQAQTITSIIGYLADVNGLGNSPLSAFSWLAEELEERLERIEVAEMTMRRACA